MSESRQAGPFDDPDRFYPNVIVCLVVSIALLLGTGCGSGDADESTSQAESTSEPGSVATGATPVPSAPMDAVITWTGGAIPLEPMSGQAPIARWEVELAGDSRAAADQDYVYVTSPDRLFAVDRASGEEVWRADVEAGQGTIDLLGDLVIVSGYSDEQSQPVVAAVSAATGDSLWR